MDDANTVASTTAAQGLDAASIATRLARLRDRAPRVHAITNTVAQTFTANLLLAAGAIPSMTVAPEEAEAFATRADALLINLGTLDQDRREAIPKAIAAAANAGKPWVLDPVFVDASPPRLAFARDLYARGPVVMRANPPEFRALTGREADGVADEAALRGIVVALTGPQDRVADATRDIGIANGHPLMSRVTAIGCAGTALLAALLAVEADPYLASVTALVAMGVAGEIAAERASGPGTFPAALVDAIDALNEADISTRIRLIQ